MKASRFDRQPQEPEYALRDVEIRDAMWRIRDQMEDFAKEFFGFDSRGCLDINQESFKQFDQSTSNIIAHVASGGLGGVCGWYELFIDEQKRRALVLAIIGNVLVEQVFKHDLFGGSEEDLETLRELLHSMRNSDAFERNKRHAHAVRAILSPNDDFVTETTEGVYTLPQNFANHIKGIVAAVWIHLKCIAKLEKCDRGEEKNVPEHTIIAKLFTIVVKSAILSLIMRSDPHTIYHFSSASIDDILTSNNMECFNRVQLEQTHPRVPDSSPELSKEEKQRRLQLSPAEKRLAARTHRTLVQLSIMDGVTAYRRGGWETPDSTITNVRYEKEGYENWGFRSWILAHKWVYCRWGVQRDLEKSECDSRAQSETRSSGFMGFEGFLKAILVG